ncbi:outer membrane lipid asymmetry maintenance protein MlaD [Vineibacter terrae]|uniref:outer membrane lipid asymmetry maintenance protein MlaD n=1 Tax=Vineibacter terrae TaxID=2586908 RepID=UPI002E36DB12|nr:outer membrane lipid asymmetry maintenance protein MlaD [Vineibacter terrae]HEX2891377.1 outer membrane lipid asymmetry maintenance protein MlaD [Vineibacter terrae]
MGRNIVETVIGAIVLCVAIAFGVYAFTATEATAPKGYEISARFPRVDGLKRGADVTMAGIKIGTVTGMELDKDYYAIVRMSIRNDIKLTTDTFAKVISESLLGGTGVTLEPGGNEQYLAAGAMITKTQGAIPFTDLLSRFIQPGGTSGAPSNAGGDSGEKK